MNIQIFPIILNAKHWSKSLRNVLPTICVFQRIEHSVIYLHPNPGAFTYLIYFWVLVFYYPLKMVEKRIDDDFYLLQFILEFIWMLQTTSQELQVLNIRHLLNLCQ